MSLRPYYLLREFTCTIFVAVHISPSAVANAACDVINSVTARLQTQHPKAFIAIFGDFNHTSISATLQTFQQFVNYPARDNKASDLFTLCRCKECIQLNGPPPTPGISDHNLVLLTSTSTSIVHQQPVTKWIVMRRSQEAKETLHACFDRTQTGMYSMTDRITQYSNSDGDRELLRTVQRELKVRLRERARRHMGKSWRTSSSKTT